MSGVIQLMMPMDELPGTGSGPYAPVALQLGFICPNIYLALSRHQGDFKCNL